MEENFQDAEISLYPESGHAPFYDEPDRFNRELATFISDRPSSVRAYRSAKSKYKREVHTNERHMQSSGSLRPRHPSSSGTVSP